MAILCLNETKAVMRGMVSKAYAVWAKTLIKITHTRNGITSKAEDATVYTLPSTVWELEQQVAMDSNFVTRIGLSYDVSLHSFESNQEKYISQDKTRTFMLNDKTIYPNFIFSYHNDFIHANRDAKRNFFAWFDFCGIPTQDKLDVVLDHKNFVNNSVVFVTFACKWRRRDSVPAELIEDVSSGDGLAAEYATDAVEKYLNKRTGNRVKVFASVEYLGPGTTDPRKKTRMMTIGLSNCREILEEKPTRIRIGSITPQPAKKKQDAKKITGKVTRQKAHPNIFDSLDSKEDTLYSDLMTCKFTRSELMEKYNCSSRAVSARLAWAKRYGETKVGYRA